MTANSRQCKRQECRQVKKKSLWFIFCSSQDTNQGYHGPSESPQSTALQKHAPCICNLAFLGARDATANASLGTSVSSIKVCFCPGRKRRFLINRPWYHPLVLCSGLVFLLFPPPSIGSTSRCSPPSPRSSFGSRSSRSIHMHRRRQ